MYLLAAGVDSTDPEYLYGLSDVIRVIRIDFVTPKVTVLTLPRDLEVQIPDLIPSVQDEIYNAKLNQAYFYGGPGMGFYEGQVAGQGCWRARLPITMTYMWTITLLSIWSPLKKLSTRLAAWISR